MPPAHGYAQLKSRRLISLRGPDTEKFLQGLVTANAISPTAKAQGGFYTAFLNGQGRLVNDAFVYVDHTYIKGVGKYDGEGDGWYVEVDAKEAEGLLKYLKKYKLRSKLEMHLVDQDELSIWSAWEKESGKSRWTQHGLAGATTDTEARGSGIGLLDGRAPNMGRRIILPANKKPELDSSETSEDSYTIRRYLKGVPEGQDELLREASLPQESNVDFMGGIYYRKGCYVGQELTIRTHHTGVVRKRVLPVMLYDVEAAEPQKLKYDPSTLSLGASELPPGTNFGRVGKTGRSAGKWLKGVGNIGLGLCRLEIMTDVVIQEGSTGWKEGDEFKLEWGDEVETKSVKAKAFVPSWHLRTGRGGLDKV